MSIIDRTELEACKEHIIFSFDAAKVNSIVNKVALEIGKKNTIKGFLKGHATIEAVKMRAKQTVLETSKQQLLEDAFSDILFENKWKPFNYPEIVEASITFNSFDCKMIVSHLPVISEVKGYKDIEIQEPDFSDIASVDDMEKSALDNIAKDNATLTEYTETDIVEKTDVVNINFDATIDDLPFDGSKGDGVVIEIGGGNFLPSFEDQLLGMKKGGNKSFELSFPDDFRMEVLRGKTAKFNAFIVNGSKKKPHDINEELAVKVGFSSVQDMQDTVKSSVNEQFVKAKQAKIKEAVIAKIIENNSNIDIPDWIVLQVAKSLGQQKSLKWDDCEEAAKTILLNGAKASLLMNIIFDKIKDVEPESAMANNEIEGALIEKLSKYPENYRNSVLNDKSGTYINRFKSEIQDEYFMNWLTNNVKVATKETENGTT